MDQKLILVQGARPLAQGVDGPVRGGPLSELIVNDSGLGRYTELVRYGRAFTSMIKAVTIAATHNSPIAINTATPALGLGNMSQDVVGILLGITFSTVSGTPAGGQAVLNYQPGGATPITLAATGNIFNRDGRNRVSPAGSVMKPLNNAALAGWLATPNPVQEIDMVGAAAAAAAAGNGGPGNPFLDYGGLQLIQPGALLALMCGSGAGTSWIVNASWTWAEFPAALINSML